MNLDQLARKYGTDKSSLIHNYTRIYEELFESFRHSSINLLEFGIAKGDSVQMWRDYFPNGNIVCIDILKQFDSLGDRVTPYIGSQDDESILRSIKDTHGMFDIIIDDGSHVNNNIISSYNLCMKHDLLKDKSFYVIEDFHTAFHEKFNPGPNLYTNQFVKGLTDTINLSNFPHEVYFSGSTKNALLNSKGIELSKEQKEIKSIRYFKSMVVIEKDVSWVAS
jgi:hypothetical protein